MDSRRARKMTRGVMFQVRGDASVVHVQVSGRGASGKARLIRKHVERLLQQLSLADNGELAAMVAAMIAEESN